MLLTTIMLYGIYNGVWGWHPWLAVLAVIVDFAFMHKITQWISAWRWPRVEE